MTYTPEHHVKPAYDTKHVKVLEYDLVLPTIPKQVFHLSLAQDDAAGLTTGTTLWLGGQVLAAYLVSMQIAQRKGKVATSGSINKAIELGSGIGFTALGLASVGYTVLATDLPLVVENVLSHNIKTNSASIERVPLSGSATAIPLDWFSCPESWNDRIKGQIFDTIVTSDSIYIQELVEPLLTTIHALCPSQMTGSKEKAPDVYLAYEHRDDAQYESFTAKAAQKGFKVKKIPQSKISKAVQALYGWSANLYEGITVLHLKLGQ